MLDYHDLYARLIWSFYFQKAQEDKADISADRNSKQEHEWQENSKKGWSPF